MVEAQALLCQSSRCIGASPASLVTLTQPPLHILSLPPPIPPPSRLGLDLNTDKTLKEARFDRWAYRIRTFEPEFETRG